MFFINENQFLIELSPYLKEKTKINGFFFKIFRVKFDTLFSDIF